MRPEALASTQPGYFELFEGAGGSGWYCWFNCPCGCGTDPCLPVATGPKGEYRWAWDGNVKVPTLSPSIRRMDGCLFHGYLEAGVWRSAGDGAPLASNVYRALESHASNPTTQRGATTMSETESAAAPAQGRPLTAEKAPEGSTRTNHLKFFKGVLHQLHLHPHDSEGAVYVPVEEHVEPEAAKDPEPAPPDALAPKTE